MRVNIEDDTATLKIGIERSFCDKACTSLNECLETILYLNSNLLHVLMQFRWYSIAMTGEIDMLILIAGIRQEDRG